MKNLMDKIDLSEFSKTGQKVTWQDVLILATKESYKKVHNFKEKLIVGDIQGMFALLKQGDPAAVSILLWTLISGGIVVYFLYFSKLEGEIKQSKDEGTAAPELTVLRDFTSQQLKEYNGINRTEIFIAIKGEVYDVTKSSDMYGENGAYHCFSGRDASRALAKLSFEEEDLSNPRYDDLGPFEKDSLENWVQKFKYYRAYPVVGRLCDPPVEYAERRFKRTDLVAYDGKQAVPDGRIDAPIYIGINGKVLDVSYGGKEHYGEGSSY